MSAEPTAYSPDRKRRLGWVLKPVVFLGGLFGSLGVFGLLTGTDEFRGFWLLLTVVAAAMLVTAATSLRAIGADDPRGRRLATLCGAVVLLGGFVLAQWVVGFVLVVLGIAVLLLARLGDAPAGDR